MAKVSIKRPYNFAINPPGVMLPPEMLANAPTPGAPEDTYRSPGPEPAMGVRRPVPPPAPVATGYGASPFQQMAGGDPGLAFAGGFLSTDGTTSEALGNAFLQAGQARMGQREAAIEEERANRTAEYFERIGRPDLATMARAGLAKEAFAASIDEVSDESEYGLNPIWAEGPDGQTGIFQPHKGGGAPKRMELPEGFKPVRSTRPVGDMIFDQFGRPVYDVGGNLFEGERQKSAGDKAGEAWAQLPGAIVQAENSLRNIDELLTHPGLEKIAGPADQYKPSWLTGRAGRDASARLAQLRGTAFLEAYNVLRGGGQITEVEGQKATDALARLDRAQDPEDIRQALVDFREAVWVGLQKLAANARASEEVPAMPQPPTGGAPGGGVPPGVTIQKLN